MIAINRRYRVAEEVLDGNWGIEIGSRLKQRTNTGWVCGWMDEVWVGFLALRNNEHGDWIAACLSVLCCAGWLVVYQGNNNDPVYLTQWIE